jgi:tetratricopeptide (TPR) repeat protein
MNPQKTIGNGEGSRTTKKTPWTDDMMDGAMVAGARFLGEGRIEDAKVVREFLSALDPAHVAGHVIAGAIAERERRWDEAAAAWGRVIAIDDDHLAARAGRGRALLRLGQLDEARRDYEVAAQVDAAAVSVSGREAKAFLATKGGRR